MNKFIKKALMLIAALVLLMSVRPILGLYALSKDYRYPRQGSVKLIKSNYATKNKILVIGCSNLQHNIDCRWVQDSLKGSIDFLYFAGSQNSTFLNYLVEKAYTREYSTIVLYAPYHLLKKSNFPTSHISNSINYGSYTFAIDLIMNNPFSFFYDWKSLATSITNNRDKPSMNQHFFVNDDYYIDSLSKYNTNYRDCISKFNRVMHLIEIPTYSQEDAEYISNIQQESQKLYVVFPPIPNIDIHTFSINKFKREYKSYFKNTLNEPSTWDSTIFYDQWYHMNSCGREQETNRMIGYLVKIIAAD